MATKINAHKYTLKNDNLSSYIYTYVSQNNNNVTSNTLLMDTDVGVIGSYLWDEQPWIV